MNSQSSRGTGSHTDMVTMNPINDYSLMVHGGAGTFNDADDPEAAAEYRESILRALERGRAILRSGGAAVEAVEACASLLEDDPLFNAGRGSVLNEQGNVEMDAAIMDGRDLSAGAVAAVGAIANPIRLAGRIMREGKHIMLAGEGALRFADRCGIPRMAAQYFLIPGRVAQHEKARRNEPETPGQQDGAGKFGTIGAVARDARGNLAAATSTGGTVNKPTGRVGDSPLIGAGVYADNETCAVSATGRGEDFMRTVLCKMISDYIAMKGMDASRSTEAAIGYLTRRIRGQGGVIVIDQAGNCASGCNTPKMIRGWIERGGVTNVAF